MPSRDIQDVIDQIATVVDEERAADPSVACVGISLAGPVNPLSETVAQSPFLGWENIPLSRLVRERTGLPTVVENDVRALTAAEHWFGAAAGGDQLRTGHHRRGRRVRCGGRTIDWSTATRGGAGQIGHLPVTASGPLCEKGHRGCVRSYLSSTLMVRQVATALGRPELTYDQLIELAAAGDPVAMRVLGMPDMRSAR